MAAHISTTNTSTRIDGNSPRNIAHNTTYHDDAIICVQPHLYISSLAAARQQEQLENLGIRHIVSLGCASNDVCGIATLRFEHLLDQPDALLLPVVAQCNKYIHSVITELKENVLVHCVYGQSRSAAVIVAYLLYSGAMSSLPRAIAHVRSARPCISINPGFLAQLAFLCLCSNTCFDAVYSLMDSSSSSNDRRTHSLGLFFLSAQQDFYFYGNDRQQHGQIEEGKHIYVCNACNACLFQENDIIDQTVDTEPFVSKHVDTFWSKSSINGFCGNSDSDSPSLGGRSMEAALASNNSSNSKSASSRSSAYSKSKGANKKVVVLPHKTSFAVGMLPWIQAQVGSSGGAVYGISQVLNERKRQEKELVCPECSTPCGLWRQQCLSIFGDCYTLFDLCALEKKKLRRKRMVPPPCSATHTATSTPTSSTSTSSVFASTSVITTTTTTTTATADGDDATSNVLSS